MATEKVQDIDCWYLNGGKCPRHGQASYPDDVCRFEQWVEKWGEKAYCFHRLTHAQARAEMQAYVDSVTEELHLPPLEH